MIPLANFHYDSFSRCYGSLLFVFLLFRLKFVLRFHTSFFDSQWLPRLFVTTYGRKFFLVWYDQCNRRWCLLNEKIFFWKNIRFLFNKHHRRLHWSYQTKLSLFLCLSSKSNLCQPCLHKEGSMLSLPWPAVDQSWCWKKRSAVVAHVADTQWGTDVFLVS